MILVTGGTGHLGANLVRRLLADGQDLRVLVHPEDNMTALDGLPVEMAEADLRDPDRLKRAISGCDQIYHCAAQVSTRLGNERELYECNVLGTRNLLAAAHRAGVARVVVTGSISATGHDSSRACNERDPFYPFGTLTPYAHTKALVEHECLKAVVDGLDVVIAVSTAIIGPNDFAPSRLGSALLRFANGRLPAFPDGGFTFVAARDVVDGHLLAMERGRKGQKYILATEYLSMGKLLEACAETLGVNHRSARIPSQLAAGAAAVWDPIARIILRGRPESLTPGAVALLRSQRRADISKATRELGFRPTSVAEAVAEAYECFGQRGLLRTESAATRRPNLAPSS